MRWLFYDPANPEEAAQHAELIAAIDRWWDTFAANSAQLAEWSLSGNTGPIASFMREHLRSDLSWELGPCHRPGEGYRLIITPEDKPYLRSIAEAIVQRAPKLDDWRFHFWRPREGVDVARLLVKARSRGSLDGVTVKLVPGDFNHIDLIFCSPAYSKDRESQLRFDGLVAAEVILGEETTSKWVGTIRAERGRKGFLGELRSGNENPAEAVPLEDFEERFDNMSAEIRMRLPKRPLFKTKGLVNDAILDCLAVGEQMNRDERVAETTVQEITARVPPGTDRRVVGHVVSTCPSKQDRYPRRTDLFIGGTIWPDLYLAFHSDHEFRSCRYSRNGETFCYLKIDGRNPAASAFEDRGDLDKALNAALVNAEAGCVISGGTGLWYSYVDFAMVDLREGIDVVRTVLQEGRVDKRAWILFLDPELSSEWVGVYSDTPVPVGD